VYLKRWRKIRAEAAKHAMEYEQEQEWYMQNGLQLNPDKFEALFTGTATQLRAVSSLTSVSVADVDLPVADSMRVLSVTLDRRLTFDNHTSAQTLACSLILSRNDYCNPVLYGAPSGTIQKLQRVQNNAARIVLQAPRRSDVNSLLQTLHWLPVAVFTQLTVTVTENPN